MRESGLPVFFQDPDILGIVNVSYCGPGAYPMVPRLTDEEAEARKEARVCSRSTVAIAVCAWGTRAMPLSCSVPANWVSYFSASTQLRGAAESVPCPMAMDSPETRENLEAFLWTPTKSFEWSTLS